MKYIFLFMFLILSTTMGKAASVEEDYTSTEIELLILENKYEKYRHIGMNSFSEFVGKYVIPHDDSYNYVRQNLAEFLFHMTLLSPNNININELESLVKDIIVFGRLANFFEMNIFENKEYKNTAVGDFLINKYSAYIIGIYRSLDYIAYKNPDQITKTNTLKKMISESVLIYIETMLSHVPNMYWANTYLVINYLYYSNFNAKVTQQLIQGIRPSSQTATPLWNRRASSNLILELALICLNRCTLPTFSVGSSYDYPLSFYKKNVLISAYDHHIPGLGVGRRFSGFNKVMLDYLKHSNDPMLPKIRSQMLSIEIFETLNNLTPFKGERFPPSILSDFLDFNKKIFRILYLSILFLILYQPIGFFLIGTSCILLVFFGKNKVHLKYHRKTSSHPTEKSKFKRYLLSLKKKSINIFANTIGIPNILYTNLVSSIKSDCDIIYKVALHLLIIGLTLVFNSFAEQALAYVYSI